ncbi:uncharacterized protein LOC130767545 [Actinidia eriantha]|uniref:uncharacterized protein LOC130767545 n=1 Tax=Actinidia eriantha TaxID=165200 RepID=UPI00258741AB|nr:uncharacterized protein LOC130767545 [Actinidia eriantha]
MVVEIVVSVVVAVVVVVVVVVELMAVVELVAVVVELVVCSGGGGIDSVIGGGDGKLNNIGGGKGGGGDSSGGGGGGGGGGRIGGSTGGGGGEPCKEGTPSPLQEEQDPSKPDHSLLLRLSKGSKISQNRASLKSLSSNIYSAKNSQRRTREFEGFDQDSPRLSTRRTVPGDVENAKLDVPETLAMPRGRKRAPVASAVRKIEAQLKEEDEDKNNVVASARRKMETPLREEISVQKAYSMRRSTRLLVKKMTESDLNNKEGIEPVHFEASEEMPKDLARNQKEESDEFDKALEVNGMYQQMINAKNDDLEAVSDEMSKDLERNVKADSDDLDKSLEVKGTNQQIIAGDFLLKTDDLEAIADEKSNVLSENVSNLEDDVQKRMEVNNEVDKVKPQQISEMIKIHRMDYEKYGKSHILSGENLEKSLGLKDEIPEEEVYRLPLSTSTLTACNSANQLINGEGLVKTNGNIYRVRERNEKSISKLGKVALHGVAPEGVDGGAAQLLSENK